MTAQQGRQRGAMMVEILGALAIATAMTVGIAGIASMSVEEAKAQQTASYHHELHEGVAAWMAVAANRTAVTAAATTTTPYKITLVSLQPHLPPGFGATNPYLQTPCVLAYYDSTTSRIEVAVTSEGGTTIDDAQLGYIVAHAGTGTGGIYASAPTIARGAYGGWQTPVAIYTSATPANRCAASPAAAGHLLSLLPFDESGMYSLTGAGEWLARNAIPGRPELNRMNTNLDMGDNRIVGLQDLYDVPATACVAGIEGRDGKTATGQPRRCQSGVWQPVTCSAGDLAVDAGGKVMSCQSGLWRAQGSAYWEDPVANKAALDAMACTASENGQTRVVLNASDGAGRPRAYTCNGSAWAALALDDNGNLLVPGDVQVGARAVGSAPVAGASGKLATGTLEIKRIDTAGTACGTNGAVAVDSTGALLSCQSGVWRAPVSTPSFSCVQRYVATWTPSNLNSANYCPAGYTKVGFDTSGRNGISLSGGGQSGDVRAWMFCCRVQ